MLDLGFPADIEKIFRRCRRCATRSFLATMPGLIVALARRFMSNDPHPRHDPDEG
ncbi:hypothetical protein [Microbacterium sp.]|uniref:hypothetical protein n=1 Tax=Microbacterium sp. TaxID=51671 RepID=UPI003A8E28A7